MGLKKSDVGKSGTRGESVGSTPSSLQSRGSRQSGQVPQRPSAATDQVVIPSPRPHASSASPVDVQAARLSRISIHEPSQNPSATNPRPPPGHTGTSRRDEAPQVSSHGSANTRFQQAHPVAIRRDDHPRTRPTYLGAARSQTSSSPAPRREDFPPLVSNSTGIPRTQPAPQTRGLLGEGRPDLSHAISALRARGILPSPSGEFSMDTPWAQEQSARSRARHSGRSGRHIYQIPGAYTGVGTGLGTGGQGATASGRHAQDSSVAPTGNQFCPTPIEGVIFLPGYDTTAYRRDRPPIYKIGVGIETEFLLRALRPTNRGCGLIEFGQVLATQHNSQMLDRHPGMDNDLANSSTRTRFGKWALIVDPSMYTVEEPWGIELITPLFIAFPSSHWRSHVEATWSYLLQHYEVTINNECGTHIHVSLEGGYSLDELKLVAQAALHFEPSFEALVPETRRNHSECQSSWIDSREFAIKGKSRAECILMISRATSFHALLRLMQPYDIRGYIWNFRSIMKYYTLEFRKPPPSRNANEALAWAELAISFVHTSIRYASPERLALVPPTVGGLRWFLQQHHVPHMNEPNRLNWIWEGLDPNSFVEGTPLSELETPARLARIRWMIELDKRRILRLIQSTREPYWQA